MNKQRISKSKCIAKQGRYVHMKKLYVFGCTPGFIDYDGETNYTHVSLPSSMDNFHPIFFNCFSFCRKASIRLQSPFIFNPT